jgi:uncharacterized protein (DUF488 family)
MDHAEKEHITGGDTPVLYTIGHSDRSFSEIEQLLRQHEITMLVDMRTVPYSRYAADFKKVHLEKNCRERGLRYVFMGKLLGGPELRLREEKGSSPEPIWSERLDAGVQRLRELAVDERVCVLCSEGNPRRCHRFHLLSPALLRADFRVFHILHDGSLLKHPTGEEIQAPGVPLLRFPENRR